MYVRFGSYRCLPNMHAEKLPEQPIASHMPASGCTPSKNVCGEHYCVSWRQATSSPPDAGSDALQAYLLTALRRIGGLAKKADGISDTDLAEVGEGSAAPHRPGQIEAIVTALKHLDIRKNILNNVEQYLNSPTINIYMTEHYDISGGQQGA